MKLISRIGALAALLALCGGFATAQAPDPTDAKLSNLAKLPENRQLRVMGWNLEHFVDPYDDPYIDNDWDNTPQVKSPATLHSLAVAIKEMNPDVMVLTEVEGDRAVKLFIDSFLPGNDYVFYASGLSMEWHQNVVVVSRYPIGAITSLREIGLRNAVDNRFKNSYNSRLLFVEIKPADDYEFLLGAFHLKASSGADTPKNRAVNIEWRKEQAKLVQDFLGERKKMRPNENVMIVGDLNCSPESEEFKMLTDGPGIKLWSPFAEWGYPLTHPSTGPDIAFDHILMNDQMAKEFVPGTAAVAEPIQVRQMIEVSDHLPVIATITARDAN
ncbi:endonuclease/exonuclease/phosphatase family protein [soil metagenome]